MSNHLTSLAYKLDVGSLLRKSVLVLLADKASDDGSGIWASKQTMADELCCSKQAVWNVLQDFMAEGLLVETGRKQHQNGYTITYALKLAALEALPRVRRWAENPSTTLTRQPNRPVNENDQGGQPGLPKPSRTPQSEAKASVERVISRWNELAPTSGLPAVRILNNSRKQMLAARIKEHGVEAMLEAVEKCHASEFCRGLKGDGRKADIMMILQPKTLPRLLEGFYNQGDAPSRANASLEDRIANLKWLIEHNSRTGNHDEVREARRKLAELEAPANVVQLARQVGSRV